MGRTGSILDELSASDFEIIKRQAARQTYQKNQVIFSEGDSADYIYFIESGKILIYVRKFDKREDISVLGPGGYFGEMAVFNKDKRSASVMAQTDATLLSLDKQSFLDLLQTEPDIADKINDILARRQKELILKERLGTSTGVNGSSIQISIKGDQSLRESAFERERYESVADRMLPQLVAQFQNLLFHRSVYELEIHFNSGEVRVRSIFDPFNEEIHPADRLANEAYIERHFPKVGYAEKTAMIRRLYGTITADPCFIALPPEQRMIQLDIVNAWEPVAPEGITLAISHLPALRCIPNVYLRNFAIGMTGHAVRMQFNCDGTHIVSPEDFGAFLEQNIG